jgi:hypothetical protein
MSFFDPHSSARASTMPVHAHARVSSDGLLFLRMHASVVCVLDMYFVCVCVRVCPPTQNVHARPLAKYTLTRTVRASPLLVCARVCEKCLFLPSLSVHVWM